MEKIIEFKNVDYAVEEQKNKKHFILKNITLEIEKGEFVCIIGLNGCGKSTFAKLLSGLISPTSGLVNICGLNTQNSDHSYEIRKKAGMIFQNPDNQIIASTLEEEIAFGLENLCIPREEMKARIKESLCAVGMEGFEKKLTSALSGGQKQRLNIASVLAMQPEIIVLDEPTSMLDSVSRKNILKLLLKIKSTHKTTIVLVTHFMDEAVLSNKVLFLEDNKVKFLGNPFELFSDEIFLKTPSLTPMQSSQILNFIKSLGYEVSMSALKTKDCAKEITKILENRKK